jgi:hypothetical protein
LPATTLFSSHGDGVRRVCSQPAPNNHGTKTVMETSAMMKRFSLFLLLLTCACLPAAAQQKNEDGSVTVSGLIIPRDDDGMYVRNSEGQFEIEWSAKADVALEVNTRLFAGLEGDVLRYKVHSSKQMIDFALPAGPITGIVTVRAGRHLETALKEANEEQWIAERGLEVYFNQQPESEQLPTPADPRFVGVWDPATKPRTLSINDKKYEVSLKKGGQSNALQTVCESRHGHRQAERRRDCRRSNSDPADWRPDGQR